MNPEVVLRIEALDNTKAAFSSVQKTISGVQATTKGFSQRIEELQPTFKRMATGGGAAFAAIAAGLGLTVREAQNAEAAQFRLSHILRTATGASDAQIKALNDQAAALEKVGVVSGESITQAQAQLATFDLQAETIGKLTPAILDYVVAEKGAAATTDDLKQLTNGLAQALNGNFGSLTRVGFVLDDVTKEMISNGTEAERAAALVSVLNSTYEGMNEAARGTAEGGMVALRNEMGRLSETIGSVFMSTVQQATAVLHPIITRITDWIAANPDLTKGLILAAAAISGVVAVLGVIGLVILPVIAGFKALAVAVGLLNVAFLAIASPIGIAVAAVSLIGMAIYIFRQQIAAFFSHWIGVWNGLPGYVQGAIKAVLGPLAFLIDGIQLAAGALSTLIGRSKEASKGTFDLGAIVSKFADPLAGQSRQVENFSAAIGQVTSDAKEAADKIKRLKEEAQGIFGTVAKDEEEANRRMAEAIVEQEGSISEKKKELRQLERDEDSSANEDRIEDLRYTIAQEQEALVAFKGLRQQLSAEIEEAERRASLTAFERKMEDMLRERAARLQAQLARLMEIQQEVEAEKQKSSAIASAFQSGQELMQAAIKKTSDVAVAEAERMRRAFASVHEGPSGYSSSSIRALTAPSVKKVNDAVITPKGDIISTHPEDWLIATKNPAQLAGAGTGGGITININGTFMDDRDAARRMGDEIMNVLKQQMRI